jgi:hypothetical protein
MLTVFPTSSPRLSRDTVSSLQTPTMRTQALLLLLAAAPAAASFETDKEAALVAFKAKTDGLFKIKDFKSTNAKSSVFGSTLLAADVGKCTEAYAKLLASNDFVADILACDVVCQTDTIGNDKASLKTKCHDSAECKAVQKKCASEAGWGVHMSMDLLLEMKVASIEIKMGIGIERCYPSECEGLKMTDAGDGHVSLPDVVIKEGEQSVALPDMVPEGDGNSAKIDATGKKMPPPMWFYIVIVGAVAAIIAVILVAKYGCCCCCKKKQADVPAKA